MVVPRSCMWVFTNKQVFHIYLTALFNCSTQCRVNILNVPINKPLALLIVCSYQSMRKNYYTTNVVLTNATIIIKCMVLALIWPKLSPSRCFLFSFSHNGGTTSYVERKQQPEQKVTTVARVWNCYCFINHRLDSESRHSATDEHCSSSRRW